MVRAVSSYAVSHAHARTVPAGSSAGGMVARFSLCIATLITAAGIATPILSCCHPQLAGPAHEALAPLAVALALVELGFVIRRRNRVAAVRPLRYILILAAFCTGLSFVLLLDDGLPGTAACYAVSSAIMLICYTLATDERRHLLGLLADVRRHDRMIIMDRQACALRLLGHTVVLVNLTTVLQKTVQKARLTGDYEVLGRLRDELTRMARLLEATAEDTGQFQSNDQNNSAVRRD